MSLERKLMLLIRQIGLVVLAVVAIAVFFAMAPPEPEPVPQLPIFAPDAGDYTDLISSAVEINELNAERSETAPQQQVVNGWFANDLLQIIATENAQLISQMDTLAQQNAVAYEAATAPDQQDDRPIVLLIIVIMAIALWGATSIPTPAPESLPIPIPEPSMADPRDETTG
jgi:hypothetical protein